VYWSQKSIYHSEEVVKCNKGAPKTGIEEKGRLVTR